MLQVVIDDLPLHLLVIACDGAQEAFQSCQNEPVEARAALLQRAADALRKDDRKYAEILTLEMGKLLGEAEVELSANILEYYAWFGPSHLAPRLLRAEGFNDTEVALVKEPLGVLYVIEPWNFLFYQVIRISAPQLMAGNTVVLKQAANVPQAALAMQQLYLDAGASEGLLTNLFASHDATDSILADPRIRGLALTGSERASSVVAATAARNLKKSTLELGGADAFAVLEDAEIEKAVRWAAFGRHWNAGQVCVSAKRLIVVDSGYDKFLAEYKKHVNELVAVDPMDPATTLAPMSSQQVADDLAAQVEMSRGEGITVEEIGREVPEQGAFFRPTMLTDIPADSRSAGTEFFGPVTQLYRAKDEDDAVRIANHRPYGLGGSVFSQDIGRAQSVARRIDTGMVYISQPTGVEADIAFGGVKNSGYGHELIDLGIKEFINQKVVVVSDIDGNF